MHRYIKYYTAVLRHGTTRSVDIAALCQLDAFQHNYLISWCAHDEHRFMADNLVVPPKQCGIEHKR